MGKRKFTLLRRRKEFESHYTVLDIGTEVIKALIVKREEDRGIVLGVGRVRQALNDVHAGAVANIQSVVDNCDKALAEAEDMSETIPGQAVVGIAGEQIRGFSTTATFPRSNSQSPIGQAEIAQVLAQVQRRAMKEAVRQMSADFGVAEVDVKLVHSSIMGVQIDGYPVNNPIDFQGHVIELTVFNTFAPLPHIGALQTIAQELDLELVSTVAEPYALAKACMSDEIAEFGAVFIDVGGGTTDVAIVRRGGIESTRMFALGGRSFTRRLAGDMNMTLDEAERLKLAHSAGKLPAEQKALAHQAVTGNAEVLAQGVVLTLEEIAGREPIPTRFYLAGGGSELPEVAEQLRAINWMESLHFSQQPTISLLSPNNVRGVHDATGLLVGVQDVAPMALARHAVTLEDEGAEPLGGLMQRVLKTMKV